MSEVTVKINGLKVKADSSQTILDVANENNLDTIPTLCYSPKLPPYGSCFLCVVEVKGLNKLVPACATRVSDGMEVRTKTRRIQESRKTAMELLLTNHYADCIGPCKEGCPAHIDVQGYVAYVNQGKYEEAIRLIKETNPMPIVCGRICVRRCEVKCRRGLIDDPVGINYLKRYATDMEMGNTIVHEKKEQKGKKVAIVGGGPAGLTAAYFLAVEGFEVEIFEAKPKLGGMLRYGIPEYRLPKKILDGEIDTILGLGVDVHTESEMGNDFTLESLKEDWFDAVFLGLGAWQANSMRVEGEYETEGVYSGLDFLVKQDLEGGMDVYGTAVVVGGGNTAIDASRTALRNGADEVIILYRRSKNEMPADPLEIEAAEHEGIEMRFLTQPVGIIADDDNRIKAIECIKMELGEPDASGRRRPIPIEGSEHEIPCDFVFSAIGQKADMSGLSEETAEDYEDPIKLTRWNTIITDEDTMQTNHPGVFAGGDVVTGPMAVIDAIGMGRKAAHAINTYLTEGEAKPLPEEFLSKKEAFGDVTEADLPSDYAEYDRAKMDELPVEERIDNSKEVELGINREETIEESLRCLECGCQQFFDCDLQRYGTEFDADIEELKGDYLDSDVDRRHPFVILESNKCILCHKCIGTCAKMLGNSALGLVNRGFGTVVRASLDRSLLETECNSCGNCIDACPTGAIIAQLPFQKPGPWPFDLREATCNICPVGCNINYKAYADGLFSVCGEHDNFELPNRGELCVRGRFGYEYLFDADRKTTPLMKKNGKLEEAEWEDALKAIIENLKKYDADEIAFLASPRMSNEELYLLNQLAIKGFDTQNISSFSYLLNHREDKLSEILGVTASTATSEDLENADVILVANSDPFTEHFIVGQQILEAAKDGKTLIVINPEETTLANYADYNIQTENSVDTLQAILKQIIDSEKYDQKSLSQTVGFDELKASLTEINSEENLKEIVDLLTNIENNVVVVTNKDSDYCGIGTETALTTLLLLTGKLSAENNGMILLSRYGNDFGFDRIVTKADSETLRSRIQEGKIKALFVMGENPLAVDSELLDNAEFVAVMNFFPGEFSEKADVFLPEAAYIESQGTMFNYERRLRQYKQVATPLSDKGNWEVLVELLNLAEVDANYATPLEVFNEICNENDAFATALRTDFWNGKTLFDDEFLTDDKAAHLLPVENGERNTFKEVDTVNQWIAENIEKKLEEDAE